MKKRLATNGLVYAGSETIEPFEVMLACVPFGCQDDRNCIGFNFAAVESVYARFVVHRAPVGHIRVEIYRSDWIGRASVVSNDYLCSKTGLEAVIRQSLMALAMRHLDVVGQQSAP